MSAPRKLDGWAYGLITLAVLVFLALGYQFWKQHSLIATIQDPATGLIYGNKNGSKIVVEFFDYQCPYCPEMHRRMVEALKQNPDVKFIVRPLTAINEQSRLLAAYMLAADKQGKSLALHDAIIAQRRPLAKDDFLLVAASAGVDVPQMQMDADSAAVTDSLSKVENAAIDLGVRAVPTYFFGKKPYIPEGEPNTEQFDTLLKTAF